VAKSAVRCLSLLSALLLGATAFTLVGATDATAKVGVTSATDGDPLGKPPTGAERVLRVGIDVQANELITTRADDRAHLMFLDGTALTIGPDASIVIDKFVYDPNTKTGDLAITATKGVFRLVGGKISKTNPITITTPSSTIGIRGGVGILNVNAKETISFFIFGFSMTVGANGRIETVTRPGSEVTTLFGSSPGAAKLITAAIMNAILGQLQGSGKGGSQGGGSGNADQSAQNSGFSTSNSGKGTNTPGTRSFDNFGSGPGPNNSNPNDTVINILTQSNPLLNPQPTTPKTENVVNTTNQMTSTITYKGTMSGLVNNNGSFSIKNGTYQNAWNVGQRQGAVTATFDGANFGNGSLNTRVVGNGPAFTSPGPIASTSGPARSLSVTGAFTGGVPTSTASTGGQVGVFAVTGNNYGAAGVFSAKKQ
jgi:hypothetical protein